jgi:hypothetical protein
LVIRMFSYVVILYFSLIMLKQEPRILGSIVESRNESLWEASNSVSLFFKQGLELF